MSKYKASIIVPVYGVEKYISKCLDSLVNQTLNDIEILVVNDGTKDNSQKIIDKYVKKYPDKVKSFIKENGGQGSARNYGLKQANGDYIGYVDSDDYVELDMYEKLYNKVISDNLDIAICDNYNVSEDYKYKKEDLEFIKFEDIKLPIPNNYDKYLMKIYGDYMKIPSEEEILKSTHKPYYINLNGGDIYGKK